MAGPSREAALLAQLQAIASNPAARGLMDDAAVFAVGDRQLVFTHDVMVEGVHFLPGSDWADVGWKLAAVNLSDLAAKGARPLGVLLGMPLLESAADESAFLAGFSACLHRFSVNLWGGDTVKPLIPHGRSFGLTAVGEASFAPVPSRSGASVGDGLWITGPVGDAGSYLKYHAQSPAIAALFKQAHARPEPLLAQGIALAPHVTAMMDVSDGLLLDASRMARASGLGLTVHLDHVPITDANRAHNGETLAAFLAAATAGDDYQLLFALPADRPCPVAATQIGVFAAGDALQVMWQGEPVPLPANLGWEHG